MDRPKINSLRRWHKVLIIFVITYVLLYLLSLFTPLRDWNITSLFQADYMVILIPFPAFFLTYFLLGWSKEMFETPFLRHWAFIPGLIIAGIIAYYVQLKWYYNNIEQLTQARGIDIAYDLSLNFSCTTGQLTLCFWEFFVTSHFLVFLLAMIGGWAAWVIADKTE